MKRCVLLLAVSALVIAGFSLRSSEPTASTPARSGIQWFATLASARAEAERTGRPILLISGTPHCAGVSGMW
jgi:hypothetical protein